VLSGDPTALVRHLRVPRSSSGPDGGSVLAVGCTIGAFFSSIPSLALSGWLFALALFGGAFIGSQIIRRLP
jgi:hypothetical protein